MKSSSVVAATVGALAAYFLDPESGRRRRAQARDQIVSRLSHVDEAGAVTAVDLRNRAKGLFAGIRQRLTSQAVPDEVLAERVRAKLGRVLSHPSSVDVTSSGGTVTLQGPVLEHEVARVVKAVRTMPGVRDIAGRLEAHKAPGNVSALQGGRPRVERMDIMQEHWSPATRALVGAVGAALVARGVALRSPLPILLGVAGGAMLVRASTNVELARLLGQRGPCIDYEKTIYIAAPVEDVFAFWQNFEGFPNVMPNVRAVRKDTPSDSHWEVTGPLGSTVQWEAEMTVCTPNELIAWTTRPGSQVEHAGVVHFQREGNGTRIQVAIGYKPPGAVLGHVVASLFGCDPLTQVDQDLMRLKRFLETGRAAQDAAGAAAANTGMRWSESESFSARPS